MDNEIDLDAFIGFGEVVLDDEPPPDPAVEAAIKAAQQEITVGEAGPEPVIMGMDLARPGSESITAVVFRSQKEGPGHVVVVVDGGPGVGRYVACNCAAMRSLGHRPAGCWAMVFVRSLVGIGEP